MPTPIILQIEEEPEINMQLESIQEVTTSDYRQLNNLPSINGETLLNNYDEIDPTVPEWAKNPIPPSADDIGAVDVDDVITFSSIDTMMLAVFG